MKTTIKLFIALLFFAVAFSPSNMAQDSFVDVPTFSVEKVNPYIYISKTELDNAQRIGDLNKKFKASWIREYMMVEIFVSHNGVIRSAVSKNDHLTQQQKDLLQLADLDKEMEVKIQYIPENTLTKNDPKTMDFIFIVNPPCEANFPDGAEQLTAYLKEKAIDKIPDGSFTGYDLAAVKFTINEKGAIINPHVVESSKDKVIDELLLTTIQNMPAWTPAIHDNGTIVKQDFILLVGNMENCAISWLSVN